MMCLPPRTTAKNDVAPPGSSCCFHTDPGRASLAARIVIPALIGPTVFALITHVDDCAKINGEKARAIANFIIKKISNSRDQALLQPYDEAYAERLLAERDDGRPPTARLSRSIAECGDERSARADLSYYLA